MDQLDRDFAFALLSRLNQRGLITEEMYAACCRSPLLDEQRFSPYPINVSHQEGSSHADDPISA